MKNLLVLAASLFVFSFSYSQVKTADFGSDAAVYQTNKSNGVYIFHVDASEYSIETINKTGSYYKDNFSVTPKMDGDKISIQIALKGINQQNKNVVTRFFVGLEIKEVNYKDEKFEVMAFLEKYI